MTAFKKIFLIGSASLAVACSTTPVPKTKWTDKNMRLLIDPDSVPEEHYVQIQNALVRSGKFTVVDRAQGMRAVQKEQERLHRNESDRFADREKWSHWGKMYGVGTIVIGHVNCMKEGYVWDPRKTKLNCRQYLSMVDSNTGEVFLAVEGENDGPASADTAYIVPDWNETVDKLIEAYPKHFRSEGYAGPALQYQDVSEEHAKRQREIASPPKKNEGEQERHK